MLVANIGALLAGCSGNGPGVVDATVPPDGATLSDEGVVPDGGGDDTSAAGGDAGDGGTPDVWVERDAGRFEALSCPDVQGTAKSLREKAEYYDALGQSLHIPQGQPLWFSVITRDDLLTLDKVDVSDNVGTWTSFYAASQAFRYAATKSPEALDNLRRVVRGLHDMERITGVRGLLTRAYIKPSFPGFPTAEQLLATYPDCDLSVKHCKRYNEVTGGEFAGWWFKNDVSKDEYAAHMFAYGVIWEIVDDPEVRQHVAEIVTAIGDHLVDHEMWITDIDGRVTTYGHMNAMSFDDYVGFNALLSLSWLRLAGVVGGKKYEDYYHNCLLQEKGPKKCIHDEDVVPYTEHLGTVGLNLGCKTNWNNHNMAQLSMYHLLRHEKDPVIRADYHASLRDQLWAPRDPYPMRDQKKTLYTFFYLVNKDPADPWPGQAASDAICTMKIFPETKGHYAVDNFANYQQVCLDRSDEPMTDAVIPVNERGMDNCVWLNNPYKLEKEDAWPNHVESPEDYLSAYWMGRFFGFITEEM
jgi:hypothetical protein